ncbi:TPA: glycosyltransferase [Vibrio vulnificus]|nr:glycosyltransferase [Vibrio vulnificus]HDY8099854.1 glycosyltransferase [Vibrio vulnificus]
MFKLLFVNFSSVFGGQERYARDIINALQVNNHEIYFMNEKYISGYDLDNEYDTCILNGNSALYHYFLKRIPANFIVYVQHSDINDGQGPRWKRWIRKILLKVLLYRVDLVIRVCDKALPEKYAPGKIVTIYNGVSLPDIQFTRKNLSQHCRLLMVGTLTKNKNQRMAIEALKFLPQCTLTLVGDGPERAELERLASQFNVQNRVTFTGFVADPSQYYQNHDLLMMLSQFEAFPYVVLEAMAAYCPVVATKVGGVPEAITHSRNGWLLNGSSSQELADRVATICQDMEHYNDIAIQARTTIESRFTEEEMVDRLLAEIEKRLK